MVKRKAKKSGSKKIQKSKSKTPILSVEKFVSKKIKITLTCLISSLIIFLASQIGYQYFFPDGTILGNLFLILVYLSGFVSVAFFIALLVFMILKIFKK